MLPRPVTGKNPSEQRRDSQRRLEELNLFERGCNPLPNRSAKAS